MATREELVKQRTKWEKEKTACTNLKSRVSDAKTTVADFKEELTEAKDFFDAAYKSDTATEMQKSIVEDREIYNQIKKALEIVVTNLTNRINDLTKVIEEAEKILEKGRKDGKDFVYTIPTLKETVFKEITLPDVLGKTKPGSGKNPSTPETPTKYENGKHYGTLPPGLTQRKTKSGKTYWTDKDGNKFIPSDKTFWKKGKDGTKTEVHELPKGLKQKTTKDGLTYFVDEEGNKYVPKDRYYTFKAAKEGSTETPSEPGQPPKDEKPTTSPKLPKNGDNVRGVTDGVKVKQTADGALTDEKGNKWYPSGGYLCKEKDGSKTKVDKLPDVELKQKTTKNGKTYFEDSEGNKYVPKDGYYTFKAASGDNTGDSTKPIGELKDGDLTPSLPPNIHIETSDKGLDYAVDEDGNWYFAEYSWYEYKPKDGGKTELKKTLPKPYNVRTTKRAE